MNENEEQNEILDEEEIRKLIKDAVKEALNEDASKKEEKKKQINEEFENRYSHLKGKKKLLAILSDERDKALMALCAIDDTTSEEYKKALNNYEQICKSYEDVLNSPWHKIDWTKLITVLSIIGAAGALVFLLLLVENSPMFPKSRNALNLIMKIAGMGMKV